MIFPNFSPPPLSAALIGLGRIAWALEKDPRREKPATHAGALARIPGVKLIGAWDRDPEARRKFRSHLLGRRTATEFDHAVHLLETLKPDLVCVATWPDSHRELVQACVEAGVSAVVCEKPLAATLAEARRLAALERTGPARTRILVNHERRYARDWQWVKERLEQGNYGEILSFRGRLYLGRTRKPALTLLHDGTHLVDILRYLSSREWRGSAALGNPLEPGSTLLYQGTLGEIPTVLEIGGARDHMVFEVEVNTSRGRLVIGNGELQAWESNPAAWASGFRALRAVPVPRFRKTGYFLNMMSDAAACARDPQRRPLSRAEDGLAALETIQSLLSLSGLGLEDLQEAPADSHKPS